MYVRNLLIFMYVCVFYYYLFVCMVLKYVFRDSRLNTLSEVNIMTFIDIKGFYKYINAFTSCYRSGQFDFNSILLKAHSRLEIILSLFSILDTCVVRLLAWYRAHWAILSASLRLEPRALELAMLLQHWLENKGKRVYVIHKNFQSIFLWNITKYNP